MTREEKVKAIKKICKEFGANCSTIKNHCPLWTVPGLCFSAGADIDRNYAILVNAGLIAPDDEIETENDEVDEVHKRFMNIGEDDKVNHPTHYTRGGIECIQAIKASMTADGFCDYCKGNVIKYIWRWHDKGCVEDLHKARVYLGWLIEEAKGANNAET